MGTIGLWQILDAGPAWLQPAEQLCGIKEADLVAAVGAVAYVMLGQPAAERVAAGLRALMTTKDPG